MKSDIDEVALQGIEFWSNVCDEEMDLAIEASEVSWELFFGWVSPTSLHSPGRASFWAGLEGISPLSSQKGDPRIGHLLFWVMSVMWFN